MTNMGGETKTDITVQRELDRQTVEMLRIRNERNRRLKADFRKTRRSYLASLSRKEASAFRRRENAEKLSAKREALDRARQQKQEFAALSPAAKKAFRRERAHTARLERRAKASTMPMQALKYVLLAALLGAVFYAGRVAYSVLLDNTAAFGDTAKVVTRPTDTLPSQTPGAPDATDAPEPTPTTDPYELLLSQADLDFMKGRVNLLVLGIDESLERAHWGTFRTDTMILMSINFETKDVHMISLPRDSYVWIYGTDKRERINTAFASGGGYKKKGFEYAMKTVSMVLGGVPVNHYVCFDMNVVKEVVNAIGGLNYDVDITVRMGGRRIDPGHQYMDGQMVLDYCRQRKGDSDISRTDRQQRMILAIFDEVKRTGQIKDIPAIYSAVTGNIYTDLSLEQIASLSAFALGVDRENIQRHTLPGGFLNLEGKSLWGINQNQTKNLVKQIFGVNIKVRNTDDLSYLRALATEKRKAVSDALSLIARVDTYMEEPDYKTYATAEEKSQLTGLKQALRTAAAVTDIHDVESTIPPITQGTEELKAYWEAVKAEIKARKQAAATPSPSPSPSPSPTEPVSETEPPA